MPDARCPTGALLRVRDRNLYRTFSAMNAGFVSVHHDPDAPHRVSGLAIVLEARCTALDRVIDVLVLVGTRCRIRPPGR